jgi:hypothetical protein
MCQLGRGIGHWTLDPGGMKVMEDFHGSMRACACEAQVTAPEVAQPRWQCKRSSIWGLSTFPERSSFLLSSISEILSRTPRCFSSDFEAFHPPTLALLYIDLPPLGCEWPHMSSARAAWEELGYGAEQPRKPLV